MLTLPVAETLKLVELNDATPVIESFAIGIVGVLPVAPCGPVAPLGPVGPTWVYITCVAVKMIEGIAGAIVRAGRYCRESWVLVVCHANSR